MTDRRATHAGMRLAWLRWAGRARHVVALALAVLCLAGLATRAEAQQCRLYEQGPDVPQSVTLAYPFNGTIVHPTGPPCYTDCERCLDGGADKSFPRLVLRYTITSTLTDATFAANLFNSGAGPLVSTSTPGSGSALV